MSLYVLRVGPFPALEFASPAARLAVHTPYPVETGQTSRAQNT